MQKWHIELINELKNAKHGQKNNIINKYKNIYGLSANTLWNIAKSNGYSKRKVRSDKGKCKLSDEQIYNIFGKLHLSSRKNNTKINMPIELALIEAEKTGVIEPGTISISRLRSILNERKISPTHMKNPEPAVAMQSLYPNHVHLFDASVCIQYYLKDGKLHIMDEAKFYKNKYENFTKIKNKIIRWVLTDHYSHYIFCKYYESPGERSEDLFDFLMSAWSNKNNNKMPFHGVPEILLFDKGSAAKSLPFQNIFEQLQIKAMPSTVKNPKRNGSVEVAQNLIERWFESRLAFQPATSIEQLNDWAIDFLIWYNSNKTHTRHLTTRTNCWVKINREKLRELPDLNLMKQAFAYPEEERTVSPGYIIKGPNKQSYLVKHIPNIHPKAKVTIINRPLLLPEILVRYDGKEYNCKPITLNDAGFRDDAAIIGEEFKAQPEAPVQKAKKKTENEAFNNLKDLVNELDNDVPYGGNVKMLGDISRNTQVYIPKKGNTIQLKDEINAKDQKISLFHFISEFKDIIGAVSPDINMIIKDKYGDFIPVAEKERLLDEAENNNSISIDGNKIMLPKKVEIKPVSNDYPVIQFEKNKQADIEPEIENIPDNMADNKVPIFELLAEINRLTGNAITSELNEAIRNRFGDFISLEDMRNYIYELEGKEDTDDYLKVVSL